jgi:hypothetical protein
MERRDFIVDEIQKFGQMVMGLIGKLVKRRQSEQYDFSLTLADQEFEKEAGFNLRMLTGMSPESLEAFIGNHPELTPANLDILSDLLIEISDDPGCDTSLFLGCARQLLDIAEKMDKTFTLERAGKREFINERLKTKDLRPKT